MLMNSNVNGGRCQCAWSQLYTFMPDELIKIIDGYTHISEYIFDAIVEKLDNPELDHGLPLHKRARYYGYDPVDYYWSFTGDTLNNSGFNMGNLGSKLDGDVDIGCKLFAGIENNKKIIRLSAFGLEYDKLRWDGASLTPFSRQYRNEFKLIFGIYRLPEPTGINKSPIDTMCDGAHAAIWLWFHGGDPTQSRV